MRATLHHDYTISSFNKLLDDSKRPAVPVPLSRLDDDHVSSRKGTLLVTVFETMSSRKARKYSAVHRRHNTSLALSKNLARFRKSLSSSWCGGNSGRILVLRNSNVFGVNVGRCTSSSW